MKTLKLALAASLLAGTLALSAAPANAAVALCGRFPCPTGTAVHTGTAYWILACPAGVVTAALVKNWKRHKELNQQEAWTCGLLYWWNEGTGVYGN